MTAFDTYSRLNMVVLSGTMSSNNGKKTFSWPPGWQKKLEPDYHEADSGFIMRTGKDVGICAIDIDDPTLSHNIELMDLMIGCNFVQQTKKGFHYIFKYDARIKQTTSESLKLDTRSDGGCIFCEPSICRFGEEIIGQWKWIKTPFEEEEISEIPEEVIQYLQDLNQGYVSVPVERMQQEVEAFNDSLEQSEADPDLLLARVINGLSIKRWDNYDSWLKIGMIFYNEGLTLDFWNELSKRSTSYTPEACGKKWLSFNQTKAKKLSESTLWFWLKEDNPSLFYTLMEQRDKVWQLIELLNNNDIAKYFYTCNSDSYLWSEKLGWFSLQWNNTWKSSGSAHPPGLKSKISNSLQELFMDIKKTELVKYTKISSETTDRDKQDKLIKEHTIKIKAICKAYVDLGKSDFCNGVISFLQSLYSVDRLEEIMDMNVNLMAFTDGVFDCTLCKFRPISPKDYISITTGYSYPRNSNAQIRQQLKAMIHGMFECSETEQHLIRVLASCLYGNNRWEQFYVLTGSGGNGKGMVNTLLKRVFGSYHYEVPMTIFTKVSEKKEQPMPELVEARNKRILMASESEKQDVLQIGFLKGISGNDIISARTLYSGYVHKYVAPFKVLLQCNNIPKLSKLDEAIKRRMIIIDFPFKFKTSDKMNEGKIHLNRLQDPDMKVACNTKEDWRDEFLLMLTEAYSEIKDWKELPVPTKVKEATEEYMDQNNPLKDWLANYYEKTNEESDFILSSELKRQFHLDTRIEKMSEETFKDLMGMNGIGNKRTKHGKVFFGLKRRSMIQEESGV